MAVEHSLEILPYRRGTHYSLTSWSGVRRLFLAGAELAARGEYYVYNVAMTTNGQGTVQ